jgi:hypothetical protein
VKIDAHGAMFAIPYTFYYLNFPRSSCHMHYYASSLPAMRTAQSTTIFFSLPVCGWILASGWPRHSFRWLYSLQKTQLLPDPRWIMFNLFATRKSQMMGTRLQKGIELSRYFLLMTREIAVLGCFGISQAVQ